MRGGVASGLPEGPVSGPLLHLPLAPPAAACCTLMQRSVALPPTPALADQTCHTCAPQRPWQAPTPQRCILCNAATRPRARPRAAAAALPLDALAALTPRGCSPRPAGASWWIGMTWPRRRPAPRPRPGPSLRSAAWPQVGCARSFEAGRGAVAGTGCCGRLPGSVAWPVGAPAYPPARRFPAHSLPPACCSPGVRHGPCRRRAGGGLCPAAAAPRAGHRAAPPSGAARHAAPPGRGASAPGPGAARRAGGAAAGGVRGAGGSARAPARRAEPARSGCGGAGRVGLCGVAAAARAAAGGAPAQRCRGATAAACLATRAVRRHGYRL